jgi:hypothetical protein
LLKNEIRNPSGVDLIKTFFKQANHSAAQRSQLLNRFAAQTAFILDFTLDDIEKQIPYKFQQQLLNEITQYQPSSRYTTFTAFVLDLNRDGIGDSIVTL